MRLSLTSLIRLTGYLALALCAVAVGLGRVVDPPGDWRTVEAEPWVGLGDGAGTSGASPRFLGMATGRVGRLPLPRDERLSFASPSPWRDGRGESHVVGLWMGLSGQAADRVVRGFGLARFALPSGRPIDRVATTILPNSPPCWPPGTSARVLFTTADGRLYRLAFEGGGAAGEGPDAQPEEIPWTVRRPGGGPVVCADPSWPRQPGLAGIVLVSLVHREVEGRRIGMSTREIWWLRLDSSASRILDAGRLTPPNEAPTDELSPVLAASPDGSPVLAYLAHPLGRPKHELRLLPVEVDDRGLPQAATARPTVLDGDCRAIAPAFSADGRWLAYVPNDPGDPPEPRRLPMPAALAIGRPDVVR